MRWPFAYLARRSVRSYVPPTPGRMNSRSVEARSVDHHQHNLGKENQQGDSHLRGRHEPRSSPDNRLDSHILLQPLDYEEAYPHRRGDGAKSGYDGDEDGEPDQVISQRGGQREEHWNAEGQETQSMSLIHISEPTRLRRISYAVFCLKKKKKT